MSAKVARLEKLDGFLRVCFNTSLPLFFLEQIKPTNLFFHETAPHTKSLRAAARGVGAASLPEQYLFQRLMAPAVTPFFLSP